MFETTQSYSQIHWVGQKKTLSCSFPRFEVNTSCSLIAHCYLTGSWVYRQ